jgi:uncharacterized surface protein with fasciclin (FAS1) repeats
MNKLAFLISLIIAHVAPQAFSAPAGESAVHVIVSVRQLSTLEDAVKAAELVDTVKSLETVTVFAPSNSAFDRIDDEALAGLLEDKSALSNVLLYHVSPEVIKWSDFQDGKTVATAQGTPIMLKRKQGAYYANGSRVTAAYVGRKVRIFVIDTVLAP